MAWYKPRARIAVRAMVQYLGRDSEPLRHAGSASIQILWCLSFLTFSTCLHKNVSCNSLSYPPHGRCSRGQAWTWLDLLFVHHLLFTRYKYLIFVNTSDRQRWPVWLLIRFSYMLTDRLHFFSNPGRFKNSDGEVRNSFDFTILN